MAKKDNGREVAINWPKLVNVKEYADWKEQFEAFVKSEDTRMWSCMIDGYVAPTRRVQGRVKVISYEKMDESEKQLVDAEKKAFAVIKMSLPEGVKHTFKTYGTSRELWEALEKRYQISSKVNTCDQALVAEFAAVKIGEVAAEVEKMKADKETAEKKDAEISKGLKDVNELATDVKVTSEPVSHTCLNCSELQGKVDRLSEQNKIQLAELQKLKESNVLLIKRESDCLNKLKSTEQEISSLTSKVNELLQVIDLARETVKEKTNELSEKCTELADAQAKIVELQGKLQNFGNSSLVRTQIQKGLKKSNDKTGVGYTKASSSGNQEYSFLPTEDELTDYVTTAQVVVDPIAVDLPNSPVSLKESVGSNSTPHKVDEDTEDEKIKTFKKGSNKKKSRKQRSCFKCHNKGHVANCCPLKKGKQKVDEVKDGNQVELNKSVKTSCQTKKPEFQSKPSTSKRFDRPRSISPQFSQYNGKSNRFQSQNRNFGYQHRYQTSGNRNFQGRNGHRGFSNSNVQQHPKFFQNSWYENQRRRYQNKQSKTPLRSDGYGMDVPVLDEYGKPKTIRAWVLKTN
ncbi:putative transcription factor interactor and regulator CCHC(Zn) family [Helianthus debilis subsp. tardiflorus]